MDEAELERALAELRGIVARQDTQLTAHRRVIADLAAVISPDLSWLARATEDADEHERRTGERESAHELREEMERIAALAGAIARARASRRGRRGSGRDH